MSSQSVIRSSDLSTVISSLTFSANRAFTAVHSALWNRHNVQVEIGRTWENVTGAGGAAALRERPVVISVAPGDATPRAADRNI